MATKSLDSLSDLPLSYLLDNPLPPQQHRGRGRPPKPKPDFHQNPTNLDNATVPVVSELRSKRPRGRPRKVGGVAAVNQRGPGNPRKSKPVSSLDRVVTPIVQDGPRKRGRPRKYGSVWDVAAAAAAVPGSVEIGAAGEATAKKRGRPPKGGGVTSVSRTGRSRGRPRKDAAAAVAEFPREGTADYGGLKRKYELLQEKVAEAASKLKAAVSAMEEVRVIAAAMNSG